MSKSTPDVVANSAVSVPFGISAINPRVWLWHEHSSNDDTKNIYAVIVDMGIDGRFEPVCVAADRWANLKDSVEYVAIQWHKEELGARLTTKTREEYVADILEFLAPTGIHSGLVWGQGHPSTAIPQPDLYAISHYFFLRRS